MQRLSIYVDDVVIFLKPNVSDLVAIRELLVVFRQASGMIVNYCKTVATLIREDSQEKELVAHLLGCRITEFPIKYLGLQLALCPLTKSQWQPMLDATVKLLPAWMRGMMAQPGRLVLVNSVIAVRPVHHLLIDGASVWLLEEVGKSM
jgi:hypothetical protein